MKARQEDKVNVRKHVSADALYKLVRTGFDAVADHRKLGAVSIKLG